MLFSFIPDDWFFTVILGSGLLVLSIWASITRGRATQKRKGRELELLSQDFWMKTPVIKSDWLSSFYNGNMVNLKLDALQPSGSYIMRGISTYMKQQYSLNEKVDCFVTTDCSNAGMAVCYVSMKLSCKCVVILDESSKNNVILQMMENQYHAEIQFYGESWGEADDYALKLCSTGVNGGNHRGNYCYVPSFDDAAIFNGNSSIVTELADEYKMGDGGEDDNYPDCIIVPVQNGDLLNGILGGLFQVGWSRHCKIIAAQSENLQLFENGINNSYKPIPVKAMSCEGRDLGYRAITNKSMELAKKYAEFNPIKSVLVKDADVLNVCTVFGEKQKVLIEAGCGVAIAAFYKNKPYFKQFSNICIIVSGGNNTYFNKDLLNKSVADGTFNEKPTNWMNFGSKTKTKVMNFKPEEEQKEMESYMEEDIDAYDSQEEEC